MHRVPTAAGLALLWARSEPAPTDFPGAMLFLASSASDFMTGSIVYLDGGHTAG
jgi:NAD(P)-dependent dehydrogenase (short-subunit alcohol dehydrogenase family)